MHAPYVKYRYAYVGCNLKRHSGIEAKKMTLNELIILNFTEIRRKSIKLWNALPKSHYNWKPDEKAMTAIELFRHVLEADDGWNIIINNGSMTNYESPQENRPFINVADKLKVAQL